MALSKIIKEGLKTTAKRGRKGRYAKAAATRKKTMEAKAIAEGRTPKPKKTVMKPGEARKIAEKGRKGDIKSLTAKQKAERSRLITQVKKEMEAAKKGLTEKPKLARMVSTIERKPGEKLTELSLNMVPASKIELDPTLPPFLRVVVIVIPAVEDKRLRFGLCFWYLISFIADFFNRLVLRFASAKEIVPFFAMSSIFLIRSLIDLPASLIASFSVLKNSFISFDLISA